LNQFLSLYTILLLYVFAEGTVNEIESKKEYGEFLKAAQAEEQWVLLDFYAPWCAHCARLNPILEEFAAARTSVRVAKIDATRHKGLATEHVVDGYPTLRFRVSADGEFRDFKGARDLNALEALDARLRSPPVTENLNWNQVLDLCDLGSVVFVMNSSSSNQERIFRAVANDRYHEASFATTSDEKIKSGSVAVVEKNMNEPYYFPFSEQEFSEASFKSWVKKHNVPLFASPLGPSIFRRMAAARKIVVAVVDPNATEHNALTVAVKDAIYQADSSIREYFAAGWLDGNRWAQYVSTFDVHDLPHLLVIDLPGKRFWNHEDEITSADAIINHLRNILAGVAHPRYQGVRGLPDRAVRFYLNEHFVACNFAIALALFCTFLLIKFRPQSTSDDVSFNNQQSSSMKKDD